MAKDCSFDVVSEVDMQEVDNAVNQAKKEIGTRYDFRGSKAEISLEGDTIKIIGDDEYKLNAIIDVLKGKMVKRNVAIKNLDYGKVEPAAGATVRQIITIKKGITKEFFCNAFFDSNDLTNCCTCCWFNFSVIKIFNRYVTFNHLAF